MTKVGGRVEELLAKNPSLTRLEAIKIVTEKNQRRQKKRTKKTARSGARKLNHETNLLERQ